MSKVGIVMGSDSDLPVMSKAAEFLDKMGIDYEMTIISAHREPDIFFEWAKGAEERGIKVIIAGAGAGRACKDRGCIAGKAGQMSTCRNGKRRKRKAAFSRMERCTSGTFPGRNLKRSTPHKK